MARIPPDEREPDRVPRHRALRRSGRKGDARDGSWLPPWCESGPNGGPRLRDARLAQMPRAAVFECRSQLRPAAVDSAADGAQLDPERGGDLLVGQALDVTEDNRGPVLGREGLQRGLDVGIQMPVVESLRGRRAAVAEPGGRLLAEPLEPDPLPAARHVQEQIRGNPVQPALERPWRIAWQRPEDSHEDLLGEVLGVVAVAGEPVSQTVDAG